MTRFCLAVLCGFCVLTPAPAQSPQARKETIAYLQALQTKSGGFLPAQPAPTEKPRPTLRATSSSLRALKYLGGEVRDKDAIARFVASCFDKKSGGLTDVPGASKPDVFSTAVGLMAVAELKMPAETYNEPAVKFLAEHAKTFEDIRIAVAGLEAIKTASPKAAAWQEQVAKLWNADGTAGKGDGVARQTGSVAVAVLRLGGKLKDEAAAVKALKAGERPSGAFGKEGKENADLETTYRVMRAFKMLKALPADVERVRSFVARCRNTDGGYGVAPGQPSSASGTYFAGIIFHWLEGK